MKQDLRVAVTKRMIQEALIRLLKNKPIDKIKVNELCEESGINRATFYRHYETLQDILREIEADVIHAMPQPRQKTRTLEDARAYLKQVCTYIYDNIGIMQILLTNRTDEEMMQSMTVFYRDYLDIYLETLPLDRPSEDTIQIAIIPAPLPTPLREKATLFYAGRDAGGKERRALPRDPFAPCAHRASHHGKCLRDEPDGTA